MIWMKALELFAGAGGAALGLKAAGLESLACVELDGDAASTLALAGLPSVHGDVRDLDHYIGMMPGLLWSSFPCQAWSTAGKRKGAEDERGGDMWKATVEVIDFTEPIWFVGENVVGLTQHRGECDDGCAGPQRCPAAYLDRVILDDLRTRFVWAGTRILNASDYGVPQHRRRLIIVAGPAPIDWPEPTHGKPTAQADLFGRQLEPWVTVRQALGLEGELGGMRNTEANPRQERPAPTDEPSPTVGGKGNAMYSSALSGQGDGDSGSWTVDHKHPPLTLDAPAAGIRSGGSGHSAPPVWLAAPSAPRVIGGGTNPRSPGEAEKRSYRDITDEPCTTIAASQIGNAGPWIEYGRGREGGIQFEQHSLDEPSCALRGSPGGSTQPYLSSNAERAPDLEIITCLNDGGKSGGNQGARSIDEPASTVRACQGTSMALRVKTPPVVGWHTETNASSGMARVPRSLDTPANSPVAGGHALGGLGVNLEGGERRRLTVQECAALQGFPAGHPFSGTKTSQYRQVGNAVPPRLAEVVARAVISKQEELEEE